MSRSIVVAVVVSVAAAACGGPTAPNPPARVEPSPAVDAQTAVAPCDRVVASFEAMTRGLVEIEWDDITEAAPAVITAIAMPFTFSIAEGIAFGFISYAAIKLVAGRFADIHPAVATLAVLFVIKYVVMS